MEFVYLLAGRFSQENGSDAGVVTSVAVEPGLPVGSEKMRESLGGELTALMSPAGTHTRPTPWRIVHGDNLSVDEVVEGFPAPSSRLTRRRYGALVGDRRNRIIESLHVLRTTARCAECETVEHAVLYASTP